MAYYFHWQRSDIMAMTMRERQIWLSQIKRLHAEQNMARKLDMIQQTEYINELRSKGEQ